MDNAHPQRRHTVRTEDTLWSIKEDPNESIRHSAQQSELCLPTLCKILLKDLSLRAYKFQLVQELNPNDHACCTVGEWAQKEMATDPDFRKKILSRYESHFWLNEYVNKHNCRALWVDGIIGP